jgi:hypothetical protein
VLGSMASKAARMLYRLLLYAHLKKSSGISPIPSNLVCREKPAACQKR